MTSNNTNFEEYNRRLLHIHQSLDLLKNMIEGDVRSNLPTAEYRAAIECYHTAADAFERLILAALSRQSKQNDATPTV